MTAADAERWPLQADDLDTFLSLDAPTRRLILACLHPDEAVRCDALGRLGDHPQGRILAEWLLRLPAYAEAPDDEDDVDDSQ